MRSPRNTFFLGFFDLRWASFSCSLASRSCSLVSTTLRAVLSEGLPPRVSEVCVSVSEASTSGSGVLLKETVLRVQAHGSRVSNTRNRPGKRRDHKRELGMNCTEYFRAINAKLGGFGALAAKW